MLTRSQVIEIPAMASVLSSYVIESPVEMTLLASTAVLPVYGVNDSLDASLQWLESEPLTPENREAISRGVVDGSQKLTAFNFITAARRARRVARSQGWVDQLLEHLMSEQVMAAQNATSPYYAMSMAKLLREYMKDDTDFIQSLAKIDGEALVAARQAAEKTTEHADDELTKKILSIPPHKREKIRRMIEALKHEDKTGGTDNRS